MFSGRGVCAEDAILIVMSWGRSMAMSAVVMRTILHKVLGRFATVALETRVRSDWSMNERGRWCLSWGGCFIGSFVLSEFCYFLIKSFNRQFWKDLVDLVFMSVFE